MESSRGLPSVKQWRAKLRDPVNPASIDVVAMLAEGLRNRADYLEKRALEYEESRKEWDERTIDQVQASELPSAHADVILARSCSIRKALYERVREEEKLYQQHGPDLIFMHGLNGRFRVRYLEGYDRNRCEAELLTMNEMHHEAVGRFIVKLKVLLSAGTMRAEEYASLEPEVVERMYYAELEEMLAAVKKVTAQMKAQAELLYAVVVSAISLLVFVYQYLIGHIDKGGTLTCSSGSFQFRATFISIVLFEGAYVWIKFRDIPYSGYVRYDKRSKKTRIEAKYAPPARCLKSGRFTGYIYLGSCDDEREANIKHRLAASCYEESADPLEPGDGPYFQIPLMSREEIQSLSVVSDEEKKNWVKDRVSKVSEEYRQWRANHSSSQDDSDYHKFLQENFLGAEPSDEYENRQQQHLQANHVQDSAVVGPTNANENVTPLPTEPLGTTCSLGSEVYEDSNKERAILSTDVDDFDNQVNPSHFQTNGSAEGFPTLSEDPPLLFDYNFRIEDVGDISREDFLLRDLLDAQTHQPFEDVQAQRPAIGVLTSGVHFATHPEQAGTDFTIASGDIPGALQETTDVVAAISNAVDPRVVDGNAQRDSEASMIPIPSSILIPQLPILDADMLRASQQENTRLQQEVTRLRRVISVKDQSLRECWQRDEAMKQMLEVRDRRVSELELEFLCLRTSKSHVLKH